MIGPVDKILAEALAALDDQLMQRPVLPAQLVESLNVLAIRVAAVIECATRSADAGSDEANSETVVWASATLRTIESHLRDITLVTSDGPDSLTQRIDALAATSRSMSAAMRFDFLFDPERKLLSIGYLVLEGSLDPSCYDLLASEARLASFVAIANGDVPARHWFRLGRAVVRVQSRCSPRVVVGIDVRVPDAIAGNACTDRQPA